MGSSSSYNGVVERAQQSGGEESVPQTAGIIVIMRRDQCNLAFSVGIKIRFLPTINVLVQDDFTANQ